MRTEQQLTFASYRLDPGNARLWRRNQILPLTTKAFAVLHYLAEHAGQLVTKAELFAALWPGTAVSDGALTVCIVELRKALRDNAKAPRFIETVHRRGYRFIAPLNTPLPVSGSQCSVLSIDKEARADSPLTTDNWQLTTRLVGRETELAHLHPWLVKALKGERQIIFVTGEPGIGKTTLIDAFLQSLASRVPRLESENQKPLPSQARTLDLRRQILDARPWLARGQCIEQYGPGESYLPVLDALGRICRTSGGDQLVTLLKQHAPTWLVQMPALLDAAELEAVQRKTAGATRERMLREFAEALEVLTLARPLVLVLEDLPWSDVSTLDLLAFIARRKEPVRLLVIGAYRPVEMLIANHPLKSLTYELYAHQLATELAVQQLSEPEVRAYLTQRFPHSVFPTRLGQVLYHRTGGNPLFLSTMVQELVHRGVLMQADGGAWSLLGEMAELESWTPRSVHHLLERQRERLGADEHRVLEAASIAGLEFSTATVAAALEIEVTKVEEHCGRLAEQQQFLRPAGVSEWPDGIRASRYGFLHALYQEFWHERVSINHQQQWHLRMGERKEAAWGKQAREIAVELAVHFEQGGMYGKAIHYLQHAGENALRRSAHQEAVHLLTKGLELLKVLSDTPEPGRAQQELTLQLALCDALIAIKGYTAPEVEKTVLRAREMCQQLGEIPQLFPVLLRLGMFYLNRRELQTTRELAEQLMRLARSAQDRFLLSVAHLRLGCTLFLLGELVSARPLLEQAIALYDPQQHPRPTAGTADPRVDCLSYASWTLWILGYPDQALKRSYEALALAEGLSHPFSLAYALGSAAVFHLLRREGQLARERAEAVMTLSTEQGFPTWLAVGTWGRGGALTEQGQVQEGIAQMRQSRAPFYLALLARAYGRAGQTEEGLTAVAEALAVVDKTGEHHYEAELYRLKGELALQSEVRGPESQEENQKSKGKGQRTKEGEARGWKLETSPLSSPASSLKPQVPSGVEKEAEGHFLKAIEIAQRQQAKSLELRAVMSLARLWQQQGKQHDARHILSEIYHWFTEGFDTKDLQEAKALLEELSD